MRRLLLVGAVAVMLALAGCSGGGPGTPSGTADDTATDGAESTNAASTPSAGVEVSRHGPGTGDGESASLASYPPGVDESGSIDRQALMRAHLEQVFGASAETRVELVAESRTIRMAYRNGSAGARLAFENETRGTTGVYWRNGSSVTLWNSSGAPAVSYSVGQTPVSQGYSSASVLRAVPVAILNESSLSLDGTTTLDGAAVVRLSIDGIERAPTRPYHTDIEDVSGYVLVTPAGVIRELHYEGTSDGTGQPRSMTMTVSDVGSTTVSSPGWASGYPDVSVGTAENGTLLTLTHEGGPSIPADTELQIGTVIPFGNTTVTESLDAGETLYVATNGSFGSYEFTTSVGSEPSMPADARALPGATPSVSMGLDGLEAYYGPDFEGENES